MVEVHRPNQASADKNLLFGVIALQVELIDKEQFAQICDSWATQRDEELAGLLVRRGWISAHDRETIEKLVQRKLKMRAGDAQAALAATINDPERQLLGLLRNTAIDESLVSMPSAPMATAESIAGDGGQRGRYTLQGPPMMGGIGQVWRARDSHLGREVALKELQPTVVTKEEMRRRFLAEARITGLLQHPGIIPLYELVAPPEGGSPYYTMKFIEGSTFHDAIKAYHGRKKIGEAKPSELRDLVRKFHQLCEAVHYAHTRQVIHRDLKPKNVVIGKHGEVMVLDWGLAKVLGEPESADVAKSVMEVKKTSGVEDYQGQILGTAAFMAPEQAAGKVDEIDCRTDVHALGAILYQLLTNEPPFQGEDVHDVLHQVRERAPVRPRVRNPEVPPALEAIALKALEKDQDKRYATAEELAKEIRRWEADERVAAHRERTRERAARWARKHPARLAALGALLVAVVVALAVGIVVVSDEQAETAQALEDLRVKKGEVDAAQARTAQALKDSGVKKDEVDAALIALGQEKQRVELAEKEASKQRKELLETTSFLVKVIDAQLADKPGMLEIRKELLAKARESLKSVAPDKATAGLIDHKTVWVHIEFGRIFRTTGAAKEAEEQLLSALALAEEVQKRNPTDTEAKRDLSVCCNELGRVYRMQKQTDKAMVFIQKDLDISQELAKANPDESRAQRDLAISHNDLGVLYLEKGNAKQALLVYHEGLKIAQRLADAEPNNALFQRDLANTYVHLRKVYVEQKEFDQAMKVQLKVVDIHQKLVEAKPNDVTNQRNLSFSFYALGELHFSLKQWKDALEWYEKDLDMSLRLAQPPAPDPQSQRDLASTYIRLGEVYDKQGKGARAVVYYRKELDLRSQLHKAEPNNVSAQQDLANSYNRLGRLQRRLGQTGEALKMLHKDLEISQRLADADPKSKIALQNLVVTLNDFGEVYLRTFQFDDAVTWYKKGLDASAGFGDQEAIKDQVESSKKKIQIAKGAKEVVVDPAAALKQPPEVRQELLGIVINALLDRKDTDKATQAADLLAAQSKSSSVQYDAACGFALCVPLASQPATKEKYAVRAVELLKSAIVNGWEDVAWMKRDPDLDALRERADFRKLVADLELKIRQKLPQP